ncbi:MAG: hypothetical protein LBI39_03930 [Puniceicoccales bacterium]|nr:hypothetical protein [Puniceicoccales bacterium]
MGFFVGTAGLFPQIFWRFLPFPAASFCAFICGLAMDCATAAIPFSANAFFCLGAVFFFQIFAGHLRWDLRSRLCIAVVPATVLHCAMLSAAVPWRTAPIAVIGSCVGETAFNCLLWRVLFWRAHTPIGD